MVELLGIVVVLGSSGLWFAMFISVLLGYG